MSIVGIVIFAALVLVLVNLARFGLFAAIEINEREAGPYLLVYAHHIGEYKNVGPVMDKVYHDLKDNHGMETTKGFGLYYDNPKEVERDKLRSIVGCIVEGKTVDDLAELAGTYGVAEYPASQSVVVRFPYKGFVSIILGVIRVYPKLSAYIEEKSYPKTPIMELYDQPNQVIDYIASVNLSQSVFDEFLTKQ